jgi:hypothetical protein
MEPALTAKMWFEGTDREDKAAKKRANGDLPQKDWRVSKPANDWKVYR